MRRSNAVHFSLTLAIAYALKRHYSIASPQELLWILSPLTFLVETVTSIDFTLEQAGYASTQHAFIIAKPCAGVNFLITVFVSLVFGFSSSFQTWRGKSMWLIASLAVAYFASLLVNAARIVSSLLAPNGPWSNLVSTSQSHQVAGVAVYCVGLFIVYVVVEKCLKAFTVHC